MNGRIYSYIPTESISEWLKSADNDDIEKRKDLETKVNITDIDGQKKSFDKGALIKKIQAYQFRPSSIG